MTSQRRYAIAALVLAGVLWGASVPLSKVCLEWLSPTWLTVGRFGLTGLVLAWIGRRGLRRALTVRVAAGGALGFGLCIVLQNVGLTQTSVSHAAVLTGVVPVFVALLGVLFGHGYASRREWLSYAVAVLGILLIARGGGGGASVGGDILVLCSVMLSAGLIAAQPGLLEGRDAAAVTAVQFLAAAVGVAPLLLCGGGGSLAVHGSGAVGPVIAFVALSLVGTLAPFWLFAYGQAHTPARLAGAFVNLEPVVGAMIGWAAFGDPVSVLGLLGAAAVLGGIGLAATTGPLVPSRAWVLEQWSLMTGGLRRAGRALDGLSSGFDATAALPGRFDTLLEAEAAGPQEGRAELERDERPLERV
jgi:O-acetylserine/cysteine efflux transporter